MVGWVADCVEVMGFTIRARELYVDQVEGWTRGNR